MLDPVKKRHRKTRLDTIEKENMPAADLDGKWGLARKRWDAGRGGDPRADSG